MRSRTHGVVVLFAMLAAAGPAASQPAASQPAAGERDLAERLFQEARTLMAAERFAEACPKLAESQRLDPAGGTVLNLAVCHEAEGKKPAAWREYHEALRFALRDGHADRERLARTRLAGLEGQLAFLVVVIPPASAVPGLEVRCDGVAIDWGPAAAPTPLAPGNHVVEEVVQGRPRWTERILLAAGERRTLTSAPAEQHPLPGTAAPGGDQGPRAPGRTLRLAGSGTAAAGVILLGVGAYFGARAIDRADAANRLPASDSRWSSFKHQRDTAALAADVTIALGAATVVAGAVLWYRGWALRRSYRLRHRANSLSVAPSVAARSGSFLLAGSW